MGAWGASLYANDCTCDVKDTYMKFLEEQYSNEDAYQQTIEKLNEYFGDTDEPLLWYALADTQWRLGRLMPEVKEKALYWIEKEGGIALWEESKSGGAGWKKTLAKLKEKLNSPMPPEKIIKKPVDFIRNPWNIGDIYAYQFHSELSKETGLFGKYITFQKIADEEWGYGEIYSRVQMYDKVFDVLPALRDLDGIRILPFDNPDRFPPRGQNDYWPLNMNGVMIPYKKRDYPGKYLAFIGNQPDNANMPRSYKSLASHYWENLEEDWLCVYYQAWREYTYEQRNGKFNVHLL
ncbi:MAG: hypothetical protein GYA50_05440 [Eubacteriaceae bacterium]|nr:hypothetical protein [Eubacteriaceae bacterium]